MTITSAAAPRLATPPSEFRLRDGRRVLIRPLVPEDRERLQTGVHRLSAASRYQRFHAAVSELSSEQLRCLTEIDQVNHIAWVALDPALAGEPAVGVARCIRLPEDPAVAEVAVTVLDAYQGCGLGTWLLGLLGQSAAAQGILTFRAYVLEDNDAMLRIFRDLGATVGPPDAGVYQLDIPVPEDPETLPDTPTGRVFKAVAARGVRSAWSEALRVAPPVQKSKDRSHRQPEGDPLPATVVHGIEQRDAEEHQEDRDRRVSHPDLRAEPQRHSDCRRVKE